jgi:hypothetical protein
MQTAKIVSDSVSNVSILNKNKITKHQDLK